MFLSAAYPEKSKLASHPLIKPEGTSLAKLEEVERVRYPHHPLSSDLPTLEEAELAIPPHLFPVVKAEVPPLPPPRRPRFRPRHQGTCQQPTHRSPS